MNNLHIGSLRNILSVQLVPETGKSLFPETLSAHCTVDYSDCACSSTATSPQYTMDELRFVNRDKEQLDISKSSRQLLLIDAPAGYGKSRLLHRVEETFRDDGWKHAYIDLRYTTTIVAFRRTILLAIDAAYGDVADEMVDSDLPWRELLGEIGGKLLLVVDSVQEENEQIMAWFRNDLPDCIKSLSEIDRFRVIVAGRYLHARNPTLWKSFLRIELEEFSEEIIRRVIKDAAQKVPPPSHPLGEKDYDNWAKMIMHLSGGHPGAIDRLIRRAFAGKWILPTKLTEQQRVFAKHVQQELDKIELELDEDTRKLLEVLFVFRLFNMGSINALKEDGYLPATLDSLTALRKLARHGLITKSKGNPFYSDKLVRKLYATRLKLFDIDRYLELNRIAVKVYDRLLLKYLQDSSEDDDWRPDDAVDVCIVEGIYHTCQSLERSANIIGFVRDCIYKYCTILERANGPSIEDPGWRQYLRDLVICDVEIWSSLERSGYIQPFLDLIDGGPVDFGASVPSLPADINPQVNVYEPIDQTVARQTDFRRAFAKAFTTEEIRRLLSGMGIILEHVSSGKNNRLETVENVAAYCESTGRFPELVQVAHTANPQSPDLSEYVAKYFPELIDDQKPTSEAG